MKNFVGDFFIGELYQIVTVWFIIIAKFFEGMKLFEGQKFLLATFQVDVHNQHVHVNTAIMLGYRMAGVLGALVGMFATILPPLIIITIVASFYDLIATNENVQLVLKGMQCGATALLLNVAIDLLKKQFEKKLILPIVIIVGTFVANLFFDVNIMLLVAIDGVIGFFLLRDKKFS